MPGGEPALEHPFGERLRDDWRAVVTSRRRENRLHVLRRRARRDPVDHRRHDRHRLGSPRGQRGLERLGDFADDARGDRAVARDVVAGHERERSGVGRGVVRRGRRQACRRGRDKRRRVAAQRLEIGPDVGAVGVQPAVGPADVARLGHRDGHGGEVGRGEVLQPGVVLGRGVRARQAGDELEAVAVGPPRDERVKAVLCGQLLALRGGAGGERRDPTLLGVGGAVGVPRLVGADEVA
jgi:hypothetical protein